MKKFRNQKGFTLIEVLIVVIIIAILATLGIARFLTARGDANEGVCDSNQASLNAAFQAWRLRNPGVTPSVANGPDIAALRAIAGGDTFCPEAVLAGTPPVPTAATDYTIDYANQMVDCPNSSNGILHGGIEL